MSNGGLLLFVAYDLACLVTFFGFHGCMHGCMDAWMHAWMHGCMHGWRVRGFGSAGFLKVEEKN